MAALFERYPDELHFYPYRKPRPDGKHPYLGWQWTAFFVAVTCLATIVFMINYDLYGQHLLKFLFEIALMTLLVGYVVASSVKVVFSAPKKQVWHSFLCFKWGVLPWRELSDIRLRDEEIQGKLNFYHVVGRKNRFLPPIPLSHPCLDTDQLAVFTYAAIPFLEEMLPSGSQLDEVVVVEVEVPVSQAETMIANAVQAPRTTNTAMRARKLKHFTEKNGIYGISLWDRYIPRYILLLAVTVGLTALGIGQEGGTGGYALWGYYGGLIGALFISMPPLNLNMRFDAQNRMFVYRTKYGFKENFVSYDSLVAFTMKQEALGTLRLCMVLEGVEVNPNLCFSRSPEHIKAVYNEACAILNIDPASWFDG